MIRLGNAGAEVSRVQSMLNLLGEFVTVSGRFCHKTQAAVMRFQHANKLQQDGVVTPYVMKILEKQANSHCVRVSVPETPRKRYGNGIWASCPLDVLPGVQIVITAHNAGPWITECLTSIQRAMRHLDSPWQVVVADDDSTDQTYAIVAELIPKFPSLKIKRFPKAQTVGQARNRAIKFAHSPEYPAICMVDADDTMEEDHFMMLGRLVESGSLAIFGDYTKDGVVVPAAPENQVRGNIKAGAVMFHSSLIPPDGVLFREDIDLNEEPALWISWFKREIVMEPMPSVTVYNYRTRAVSASNPLDPGVKAAALAKWVSVRNSIMDVGTTVCEPLVSCLMLTGKCPERYPLARVAIKCFLDQTWQNKELVIINHGKTPLATGDPRIIEVMTEKGPGVALGDLRNMSLDNAHGTWCAQWDDDDWSHPTRLAQQMKHANQHTLVTYLWQVRLNLVDDSAFYDMMAGGQHMSILFYHQVPYRYLPLECREDTEFLKNFSSVYAIDNSILNPFVDPMQYVRTYHGRNVWTAKHIMEGSDTLNVDHAGELRLTDYHADKVREIISAYKSQAGFSGFSAEHSCK